MISSATLRIINAGAWTKSLCASDLHDVLLPLDLLLAALDLCFAAEAKKLLDAAMAPAAATAVQCLVDSRERLRNWLQGASRPKALNGALCAARN